MIFRAPLPLQAALDSRLVRQILPTDFRTRLLQTIAPYLKERAMFSAGVTNAEFLQQASDAIDAAVSGESDVATKRAGLKKVLEALQYNPVPDERGTLTDLSSDPRLNLIINTGQETAAGYGAFMQGQDPAVRDQWPALELVRIMNFDSEHKRNWAQIWTNAGGQFYDGRMIALKDDLIWDELGDPDVVPGGLGNPYPPFALHSGMWTKPVDRDTAIRLKLIDRDTQVAATDRGFNQDLQASPEVREGALQDALLSNLKDNGIAAEFVDGVLKFVGGAT